MGEPASCAAESGHHAHGRVSGRIWIDTVYEPDRPLSALPVSVRGGGIVYRGHGPSSHGGVLRLPEGAGQDVSGGKDQVSGLIGAIG